MKPIHNQLDFSALQMANHVPFRARQVVQGPGFLGKFLHAIFAKHALAGGENRLDLRGGSYLLLEVDMAAVVKQGEVDILLASASNGERLVREGTAICLVDEASGVVDGRDVDVIAHTAVSVGKA